MLPTGNLHNQCLVCMCLVKHYTLILGLEPLDCILSGHPLGGAHTPLALAAPRHPEPWPLQLDVKVHTKDPRGGVILDTQINVLRDAKPKVACKQYITSLMPARAWLIATYNLVVTFFSSHGRFCKKHRYRTSWDTDATCKTSTIPLLPKCHALLAFTPTYKGLGASSPAFLMNCAL
jgi:hypothetical protein